MTKYIVLNQPASTSLFDFFGMGLPLIAPLAMGAIGVAGIKAMSMQAMSIRASAAELASHGQPDAAMPHRPAPARRNGWMARYGCQ